MSDEIETPAEPIPEPSPDESPFDVQPLDTQEKGLTSPWETRDGD
jgi:hypothetical protein